MTKSALYFDLHQIFCTLNNQFFNNSINAQIKWGKARKVRNKRSICLGSYNNRKKIIVINPALNQQIIPLFCLERVIFHEMLHEKFPKKLVNKKHAIHNKDFLLFEKNYPNLTIADDWIKNNLKILLQY